MVQDHTAVHLLAGGVAGTTGAVITCPLEVVKTRLQSSCATFKETGTVYVNVTNVRKGKPIATRSGYTTGIFQSSQTMIKSSLSYPAKRPLSVGLWQCLSHIVKHEGIKGLWKGLGPNLVGVAPSRAIYFYSYANAKKFLNSVITPETPLVHILSASCAGFTASTTTNPIWFVKTRVQLDQKRDSRMTAFKCARDIYNEGGLRAFYKGITASYYGISETVIHFVIYEAIKASIREYQESRCYGIPHERSPYEFAWYMGAGATSKTIATCIAYPHEVARTRLRQEGDKYKRFWQTLSLVAQQEGPRGLYRGLCTQLVRQIPNTAIMMCTYEIVVYYANLHWNTVL